MAETGSDGLPFIGSLMSLVSQGNLRYEGVLYTIDMPNSTIALSNVRCFGTEGRRPGSEVPPSDQVFEYVVFKGSEIKELTVVQPPPPQPPAPQPPAGFSDPAIVSAGPPPPSAAGPWGAPPPPGPQQPFGGPPGSAPFANNPWGPPPSGGPGIPPPPGPAPPPPAGQPAPAPAPTVAITPMGAPNGGASSQQQRPSSYAHAAGGPQQRGGRGGRGQQQHGGRGQGGGRPHQQQQPRPPPVEVPKEEFNFEEALKKFDKEQVVKEAEDEHVPVASVQSSYKKDDFFDQLSCDTLERLQIADGEREDWRSKMAAQRKVDVETFGGMATHRSGRGYRGRGRGRGYYGGRGRGGGGRGRGGQQQQPAAI